MSFNVQKFETAAGHLAVTIESGLKFLMHFAAALAPVADTVASATGHRDVVGDINKAGQAANLAEQGLSAVDGVEQVN